MTGASGSGSGGVNDAPNRRDGWMVGWLVSINEHFCYPGMLPGASTRVLVCRRLRAEWVVRLFACWLVWVEFSLVWFGWWRGDVGGLVGGPSRQRCVGDVEDNPDHTCLFHAFFTHLTLKSHK